jgi:hypothetical protein
MISQEYLKSILIYNEKVGKFYNLITRNSRAVVGEEAGSIMLNGKCPYYKIGVKGVYYKRCNLAYLYITGNFPKEILDHRDGNSLNDSWENLRLATPAQNRHNSKIRIDNISGVKGVYFTENKCAHARANIQVNGKRYRKTFAVNKYGSKELALQEAEKYVRNLRQTLHGEYTNHG